VERVARLDQRQVERPPVVGDERKRAARVLLDHAVHVAAHRVEQRPLIAIPAHQILTRVESAVVEVAAPDQERVRASAPAQPGGLEVEEQQARGRDRTPPGGAEQRGQVVVRRRGRTQEPVDVLAAVLEVERIVAPNDDAGTSLDGEARAVE